MPEYGEREQMLDEATSLLNRNENGEALRVLRKLHCLDNAFECRVCRFRSYVCKGGLCPHCSGDMSIVVVRGPLCPDGLEPIPEGGKNA